MRSKLADWLVELLGVRLAAAAQSRHLRQLTAQGLVSFGVGVYGIPRVLTFRGCEARLRVGNYSSITTGATVILGGNHPTSWVSLYPFRARFGLEGAYADGMPTTRGDVEIGPDCWIGHDALILSGVRIGIGAVVGARAVVSRDVPDFAVVAGNPAVVVKYRFPEDIRQRLAATRWWELPRERLVQLVPLLSAGDAPAFLAALEN